MPRKKPDLPSARRLLEAEGIAKARVDSFFRGLDADLSDRLRELLKSRSAPKRPRAPPQVVQIELALAHRSIRLRSFTKGRPVKVVIEAHANPVFIGEDHADWYCRLVPGRPVTAAVYYASHRSNGNAPFNVTGFLDTDLPATTQLAQPDLYFFVLMGSSPLEDARVWVLARGALRDIYKEIREEKKKVDRFTSPKPGCLRLLLPETKLGFDLDQCVYVEDDAEAGT